MCGIVGYLGEQPAAEILIEGLRKLEYRGYDSAGIAVAHGGQIQLRREVGKLRNLENQLREQPVTGQQGIGHTRWATHGRPTTYNAHPHVDGSGKIVVVHNGIIENYLELKNELVEAGHVFQSDTDTEVIAHLVQSYHEGDLLKAVHAASRRLLGTYACAVLHQDEPERIIAIKHGAPLLAGLGDGENFVASDAAAIINHTRRIIYLEDGEIAVVTRESVEVLDGDLRPRNKEVTRIDWNLVAAEKAGYEHFMLKEIHEQPATLTQTLGGRFDDREGRLYLDEIGFSDDLFRSFDRAVVVACGTALYAGMVGKYLIEQYARIPVETDYASEFRYRQPVLDERTLVIFMSQSGETADTLAALREAKRRGAKTLGIINVKGSSIAREVDGNLFIHAGPEIGVASTKAYSAMVAALTLLSLHMGQVRGKLNPVEVGAALKELKQIPAIIGHMLESTAAVKDVAHSFMNARDFLYLGRGVNFPTALEGALKLKEISYIHAEAYASGEMKHGPIALIDEHMPTVAIATQGSTYDKVVSNLQEVKARNGVVIAIATEGDTSISAHADRVLFVPAVSEALSPLVNVVPLQLLAYHIARLRGCDVDQPRNLAKSVTVE
ncbi:MAG: glutamine--fructose-6-phosphate transaminase (isomerizing) [bacterium]|nr:glutamine--fructose-6-phosphate transaminase (isomerizing) [bacterium]